MWSIVCCRHVDLHSIGTMMGFHAEKLRQNETLHCHSQMKVVFQTYEWERRKLNTLLMSIEEAYYLVKEMLCVSVFPRRE
jgi:hypothetical protein